MHPAIRASPFFTLNIALFMHTSIRSESTRLQFPSMGTVLVQAKAWRTRSALAAWHCTIGHSLLAPFNACTETTAGPQGLMKNSLLAVSTTSELGSSAATCSGLSEGLGLTKPGRVGGAKILRTILPCSC